MSLFSPRRYQAPFKPYHRDEDTIFMRAFTTGEQAIKSVLFSCRMCGNCILQETAFICPMTCPKGLRNGLCGGATPEACEVDPSRPCTWYLIYDFFFNRQKFDKEWDSFFYDLRQPDWWRGDSEYHPPAYEAPISLLEANLRTGNFVTTGEIAPPLSASGNIILKKVDWLKGYVAAANFTDNASASARMSSIASSKICLDAGLEPIMQLQARDRTRVVIESDVMGAAGLGIRNVLCLSGDHHRFGPSPMTKPDQFDMDAIQILWMLRRMRDEGTYIDGRNIKNRPQFFLGAAGSPFGAPPRFEAIRAEKKINAGAQFIQTQPIFDYSRFLEWLEALDKRNLLDKVYILAGMIPLKSARAAHFMAADVPGVVVPTEVIQRMDAAGDDKDAQPEVGVEIALEMIEKLRNTKGINGIHLMAVHWEEIIPRLVEEGNLPRPSITELPEAVAAS
jgi:methylenetetrahydrofolate reductase (NADPH)